MERSIGSVDVGHPWKVRPPGGHDVAQDATTIVLEPGVGFGTGSHETTQLCLLALRFIARTGGPLGSVLDFGSGSGILAIAAAKLGATVHAVDIDKRALEHARHNARLNGVDTRIGLDTCLRDPSSEYDVLLANILRPVLLEWAPALCARQSRKGHMVLSGLLATDVPEILACYQPRLAPMHAHLHQRGEWWAVMFSP